MYECQIDASVGQQVRLSRVVFCFLLGVAVVVLSCAALAFADEPAGAGPAGDTTDKQSQVSAIQTIYRAGVPHTDSRGRQMKNYDSERSFLPITMWGPPAHGAPYGHTYDWQKLKDAGFNSLWPWPMDVDAALETAQKIGLQVVLMHGQSDETLEKIKDHPSLLGNVWMDEPIGQLNSGKMQEMFDQFTAYKKKANSIAPDMLVFINDAPWITPPATEWWVKWNTAGDVSCHDNYPIWPVTRSINIGTFGSVPNGIPQSVTLAVRSNNEARPIWLIVGAFDTTSAPDSSFPFRYPTPVQLRALVYSGIIHGATGIVYFVWDSYVSRDGGVIGFSPDPDVAYVPNPRQQGYPQPAPAKPMQLVAARALWDAASRINMELEGLTASILSPTVGPELTYTVEVEGEPITDAPIRTLLKPGPDGSYILLTVNLDNAVLKATYGFDRALKSVHVLFENRFAKELEADTSSLVEYYEPFDTHVFRLEFEEP